MRNAKRETTYRVYHTGTGEVFGTYSGRTQYHAVAAMLREAGYSVQVRSHNELHRIVVPAGCPFQVDRLAAEQVL